ncbi:hypothetical protein GCM10027447_17280 [Glycomyces halotolerans]
MSASASAPRSHRRPSAARPLARVVLRTAGLTALIAWAALLVWASFGGASTGSSGFYMIIGTVASVLLVSLALAAASSGQSLRTIAAALGAAIFAAAAGWAVYSAMPDAGPGQYITLRAGVAALAYGFGVVGGGLLALSEFVVEGYVGGRRAVPTYLRRKVAIMSAAVVVAAAVALAPAMQRWAELANQDVRTGLADAAAASAGVTEVADIRSGRGFVETPFGLLRVDYPDSPSPQAVTLLDPATGDSVWYHRRWNWLSAQSPVLSHAGELVALSGPRADDPEDFQTRVLRTRTGDEVATAEFDRFPGRLLAIDDDRLVFTGERSAVFTAYDFSGERLWEARMPPGCEGTAAQTTGSRLLMLADCVPAPDRTVARDHVLAFDLADGAPAWEQMIDRRAQVVAESFLVTDEAVIIDSRIEQRVTDGPFSARRFEHKLIAYGIDDGERLWRQGEQTFGSTNSSACGGTLHLSAAVEPADAGAEDAGDGSARATVAEADRRTVQLVECYTAADQSSSFLGLMAYDVESGKKLYTKTVRLGFTPLDPAVARGWATVLPDNRAMLATDRSLDRREPDCRLYEVAESGKTEVDLSGEDLPANWCHEAQLTTVAGGVAVSFVEDAGTRGVFLII